MALGFTISNFIYHTGLFRPERKESPLLHLYLLLQRKTKVENHRSGEWVGGKSTAESSRKGKHDVWSETDYEHAASLPKTPQDPNTLKDPWHPSSPYPGPPPHRGPRLLADEKHKKRGSGNESEEDHKAG